MVKAVIFDCFGVIITDAMQAVTSELSEHSPEAAKQVMDIIHANNRGLIVPEESNRSIAAILGITPEELRSRISRGEVKDEQMMAYIKQLHANYKTALLSNVGVQSIHRRFTDEELQVHFDAVIISGELGVMKPDPEIYVHAANKLGVGPEECVFVDDREVHCQGAVATGMQAILYEELPQLKRELAKLLRPA